MKKILGALAVVAMITLLAPAPAEAQATGDVELSIDLSGGILILYYYNSISVPIDASAFYDMTGFSGGTGGEWSLSEGAAPAPTTVTVDAGAGTVDAAFTVPTATLPVGTFDAVLLTLQNVWAVRAFGTGNGVQLDIAGTTDPLINGSSQIAVSDWEVASGAYGPADPIQFPYPGFGGSGTVGDVLVTLDFTNVSSGGIHTTAATEYTLTATNY